MEDLPHARRTGLSKALDSDGRFAARVVDVDYFGSAINIVVGGARFELEVRCEHLLHKERRSDRLEHVVHCLGDIVGRGVWLGDKVGELGMRLPRAVACSASDNLDDLREGTAIADGKCVLAVNPVEALL